MLRTLEKLHDQKQLIKCLILRLGTILLLIWQLVYTGSLNAQDTYQQYGIEFVEPSPNSMSLLDLIQQPINLYSGTPNINIPIVHLKGRSMDLPISLAYDGSGNKVNEVAGWAGLGWGLQAGGIITRIVKDTPDEGTDGFFTTRLKIKNFLTASSGTRKSQINSFEEGDWDNEPDMFYVAIPGFSGGFVFDTDGYPLMMPDSNFKIEPAIGPHATQNYWRVLAPDGTQYFFGENSAVETTEETRESYDAKDDLKETKTHTYVSTWYLTRIVNAKGQDEFNFTYSTGLATSFTTEMDIMARVAGPPGGTAADTYKGNQLLTTVNVQNPKYLSTVTSLHGSLSVETNSLIRVDLTNGRSLKTIKLKNKSGLDEKVINFNTNYFQRGSDLSTRRLKLSSFQEVGMPAYSFEYYETENLPDRNTHQIDSWGYFNSSTTDKSQQAYPQGSDRSVDANRVKASILTKINYPTGGYKQFIYESNQYRLNNQNKLGAGTRVSSTRIHDGLSSANDIVTTYDYTNSQGSSGQLSYAIREYQHNVYKTNLITYNDPETITYVRYLTLLSFNGFPFPVAYYVYFSGPRNYIPARPVGYSRVVVNTSGNGSSEYLYTNYDTRPDVANNKYNLMTLVQELDDEYPIMQDNLRTWERGLLLQENVRDNNGRLIKQTINTYQHGLKKNNATSKALFSVSPTLSYYSPEDYTFFGIQTMESMTSLMVSSEERVYDQENWSGNYFTSSQEVSYSNNFQVAESKMVNSEGDTKITTYKYPLDYNMNTTVVGNASICLSNYNSCIANQGGGGGEEIDGGNPGNCYDQYQACLAGVTNPLQGYSSIIKIMVDRNIISEPIEVIRKIKKGSVTKVLSASLTEFYQSNGQILPKRVFESDYYGTSFTPSEVLVSGIFEKDASYEEHVKFDEYNSTGGIKSFSKTGGDYRLRYLYEYDGSLPVAEIKNVSDQSQVAYSSFETLEKGGWNYFGSAIPNYESGILTPGVTGANSYLMTSVSNFYKNGLDVNKRYVVSFWARNNSITVNGSPPEQGPTNSKGWTLYYKEVLGVNTVTLASNDSWIDEVRLHPLDAIMTTYTYDPLLGMTSMCMPNSSIRYYEYDSNMRLKAIKDLDGKYLQLFDYQYQVQIQNTGR